MGEPGAGEFHHVGDAPQVAVDALPAHEDHLRAQQGRIVGRPGIHGLDHLEPQGGVPFPAQLPGEHGHGVHQGQHVQGAVGPAQEFHFLDRRLDGLRVSRAESRLEVLHPETEGHRRRQFGRRRERSRPEAEGRQRQDDHPEMRQDRRDDRAPPGHHVGEHKGGRRGSVATTRSPLIHVRGFPRGRRVQAGIDPPWNRSNHVASVSCPKPITILCIRVRGLPG